MPIPMGSGFDAQGTARITNLPDAVSNQEPATLGQLNAAAAGLDGSNITTGTVPDARLSLAMQRGLAPSAFDPTSVFQVGNNDWTGLAYETSGALIYSEADGGVVFNGPGFWATVRLRMPVDPNATYTARVVMKKLTGTGVVYVGAKSLNNAFANLATDSIGSYNYFGALGVPISVGVTQVLEGSISGYNPTSPTAGVHTKFDPQAKYWDLVLIANYSGTGTTVVQSIEIIKQPLVPLRLSPSTAARAGFNLPHGVAPTSPVDGDFWSTTTGLFLRVDGVTRSFLHGGSSLADLATRSAGDLSSGTLPDARFPATLPALSGVNLTSLNASNLGSGTVALARLANIADAQIAAAAAIAWTKISKTGSSLADLTTRSATDLTSGTLPDARFPATLPALSGVNLTALNASNLGSGTVPDARLSSNVPLKNTSNTFTDDQIVSGAAADKRLIARGSGAVAGQGGLQIDQGSTYGFHAYASSTGGTGGFLDFVYKNIGTNTAQNGTATYRFNGPLTATSFGGDGASVTNLNASNLATGTVPDARFPATLPAVSGVNLTALNASNLASGIVALARLANIADAQIAAAAAIAWTKISKTGSSLADLTTRSATDLTSGTLPDARFPATLPALSGVNLTALNASNLGSGTVPDARLAATVGRTDVDQTYTGKVTTVASTTTKAGLNVPHGTAPTSPVNGDVWTTTTAALVRINAATRTFLLDNSSLNAANLTGTLPALSGVNLTNLNASNLASGTVPDARFPATLPAVSGVNLTNLNASNLASGTVPDARLAATVGRTNVDQTYTGKITTLASSTTKAGLNIPHGAAPTTPVNGDVWTTTTDALVRINSVTRTFLLDNSALNATNMTTGTLPLARLSNIADAQIAVAAAIAWTKISKTGSSLADLTTRSAGDLNSGTLANARTTGVSAPTPSTLALRDAAGRMQAANPSAAQDVATKSYVDSATGGGATGSDAILYSIFGF